MFLHWFEQFFFLLLGNSIGIPNPIMYFTSNDSLDHKSPISRVWTDLNIFFLWLRNSMGIPNLILYFTSNDSLDHKCSISCLWTDLTIFFPLTWKFDGDSKSNIVLYLKWLTGPQKSNFLFMDWFEYFFLSLWLGNSMEIPNPILYFTSNYSLDHKSPISC